MYVREGSWPMQFSKSFRWTELILLRSILIPLYLRMKPKNLTHVTPIAQLSGFIFQLKFSNLVEHK